MLVVHGKLISELIKIEEQIFSIMEYILNLKSVDDDTKNNEVYNYLKMLLKKEKRIFSKFPKDESFISFVENNLNDIVVDNIINPDNITKIISRIFSFLNYLSLDVIPDEEYSTVLVGNKLIQYDLKQEHAFKKYHLDYNRNLVVRYLKDLENLKNLGVYDESDIKRIQFLNLFFYGNLCFEFAEGDFDVSKLSSLSDNEFMMKNGISEDDFLDLKQSIIFSNISTLIKILFNEKNDYIDHLDADYNLKYLLTELSYDDLIELSEIIDSEFENIVKNGDSKQIETVSIITTYIETELDRKKNVDKKSIEYENMTDEEHYKLINLIDFEKKFLDVFDDIDIDSKTISSDINYLNKMQELENDLVEGISFDNSMVSDFATFINEELPTMLDDRDLFVIQSRLRFLFPEYSSLFISPSQSNFSHDLIFRNFIVDTLRNYYDFTMVLDKKDREFFLTLYKDYYFMYPFLTKELISFNGNHLMIDSVSDDIIMDVSDIDEIEFDYDLNEQLYNEACGIINEFNSYDLSKPYFLYKLIQFDYIVRIINMNKLEELYNCIDSTDIQYKELLESIVTYNVLDEEYSFEFSYDKNDVKVKIIGD